MMWSRTRSVRRFLTIGILSCVTTVPTGAALAQHDTLRVGYLVVTGSPLRDATALGLAIGIEEARRTAALFGLAIEMHDERTASADSTANAAARLLAQRLNVLITATDDASCATLASLVGTHDVLVFDLVCAAATPPTDACTRKIYHVRPRDARVLAARDEVTPSHGSAAARGATVELWHPSLRRFGAAQLNQRFVQRFGEAMHSPAWAAWTAAKIAVESALRTRSTDAATLARYLARPDVRFDGHKGEPLTFDASSGEMRQPLYVVGPRSLESGGTSLVAEVTVASVFSAAVGPLASSVECRPDRASTP